MKARRAKAWFAYLEIIKRLFLVLALCSAHPSLSWTLSNFTELSNNSGATAFASLSGTINIANTGDLVVITLPGNCATTTCTVGYSTALDFSAASVGSTTCVHVVNATGTTNLQGNALWKCENVAAGSGQALSVTFNQSIFYPTVHVADWSGGQPSSSSEGANSFSDAGGTSGSPISITTGTIHAGDLVISSQAGASPGTVSVGACCTTVQSGGAQGNATEYSIATAALQTNTWTFTGSATHISMVIAAFLPLCTTHSLTLAGVGC